MQTNRVARDFGTVLASGLRGASPVDFFEDRDRLIGPIFRFSIKGGF